MIDLILMVILMFFSIDIILAYKYKIMHKSKHKYFLAFLHAYILLLNLFFIFYLGIAYSKNIFLLKILGAFLMLLGIYITIHTLIVLKEAAILPKNKLIIKGPFKYARHPIYLGYILIVFGFSSFFSSLYLLIYSLFLVLALNYLSRKEEEELIQRFGRLYLNYMKKTHRFIFRKF